MDEEAAKMKCPDGCEGEMIVTTFGKNSARKCQCPACRAYFVLKGKPAQKEPAPHAEPSPEEPREDPAPVQEPEQGPRIEPAPKPQPARTRGFLDDLIR
jgi:hypothetical protein